MGKNAWDELADSLKQFGYVRPPEAAYQAAVQGGVKEPGRTASYALPQGFQPPTFRNLTADEAEKSGALLGKGILGDQLRGIYKSSFQDPNSYITKITPEAYFESVYGPAWKSEVKPAALLSQSRPDGPLASLQGMKYINPSSTQDALTESAYIVRTPGLGFQRQGVPFQSTGFLVPRGPWEGTIFAPRAMHDMFGTGHHEMGHLFHKGIPTKGGAVPSGPGGQPFFDGQDLEKSYNNRFVEVLANTGMMKRGHFQHSGTVIRNTADAREFLDGLLSSKVRPADPDPIAQFGPRKGNPVEGDNYVRWGLRNMLLKAGPAEHSKFVAILPKVFSAAAPVAAGAASATSRDGGER